MNDYYLVVFYSARDGSWIADVPELEYCSAFGDTPEQAVHEVMMAKEAWLASARAHGDPVPEPRYEPELYKWLDSQPRLLTTKEAALRLGIAPSRVRQLILSGLLPAEKAGRDLWIDERDLEKVRDRPAGYPKGRPRTARAGGKMDE